MSGTPKLRVPRVVKAGAVVGDHGMDLAARRRCMSVAFYTPDAAGTPCVGIRLAAIPICALLPVHTVGVMGDAGAYEALMALRAVTSTDGMTVVHSRLAMPFSAK